jgi:hypothetical protein
MAKGLLYHSNSKYGGGNSPASKSRGNPFVTFIVSLCGVGISGYEISNSKGETIKKVDLM